MLSKNQKNSISKKQTCDPSSKANKSGKIPYLAQYNIMVLLNSTIRGVPTSMQIRMCVQLDSASIGFFSYSKTCLNQPIKNRQQKTILMTNGSLMICSLWSILQYF